MCIKFVGWGGILKKQILLSNKSVTLFETYMSLKYNDNPAKKVIASYALKRDEMLAVVASVSRMILKQITK